MAGIKTIGDTKPSEPSEPWRVENLKLLAEQDLNTSTLINAKGGLHLQILMT
jgi:hypothetical protein